MRATGGPSRQDESMPPRLAPLRDKPITFAHRGARAHAPENTIEAFQLGLRLGATGLESDVWITKDRIAVLDHDGSVGSLLRRRPIDSVLRADLPDHIPSLAEFYDEVGTNFEFSLDMKDPAAFEAVVSDAKNAGAEERLWLCHPSFDQVVEWRHHTEALLVDSTRLSRIKEGPERRALRLRDHGVDAINLRNVDWTGGLVATFHRFGRFALGWDAQHTREIVSLIDIGIDGVFSDHVDRLSESLELYYPTIDPADEPTIDVADGAEQAPSDEGLSNEGPNE